jgi:hypothetical protein
MTSTLTDFPECNTKLEQAWNHAKSTAKSSGQVESDEVIKLFAEKFSEMYIGKMFTPVERQLPAFSNEQQIEDSDTEKECGDPALRGISGKQREKDKLNSFLDSVETQRRPLILPVNGKYKFFWTGWFNFTQFLACSLTKILNRLGFLSQVVEFTQSGKVFQEECGDFDNELVLINTFLKGKLGEEYDDKFGFTVRKTLWDTLSREYAQAFFPGESPTGAIIVVPVDLASIVNTRATGDNFSTKTLMHIELPSMNCNSVCLLMLNEITGKIFTFRYSMEEDPDGRAIPQFKIVEMDLMSVGALDLSD